MRITKRVSRFIKRIIPSKVVPIYVTIPENRILEGKIAVVTGGSSGIGLAIAKKLHDAGASIIIVGRNLEKLQNVALNNKFDYLCTDISNVMDIEKAVERLVDKNTIPSILVNCAGLGQSGDFWSISEDMWDRIIDTNLKGTFFFSQKIARLWIDKGIEGHILNVSSSSAKKPAWGPYQISKWGIRGFTLGLAKQLLPYGIVVNAIAPGKTATEMMNYDLAQEDLSIKIGQPIKRYITPEEIANLSLFMVSNYGNAVIGDTFYMTGGNGLIEL